MTTTQQAVARRDESRPSIAQYLERLKPEIQRALPKGLDADRITRLALTVVRRDRALQSCDPASFAGALLTASALGLEPGVNGEAWLVAYKGECTLIVGYQGLAKLFWQHPMARHLDAQAVCANDEFDYAYGLDPFLTHKPAVGDDRGDVVAYYAVAALSSGAKAFVVLTPKEVRALRGGKVGSSGGIADPMHWMERKTALRQLFKLLPKTTTLTTALEADEKTGSELYEKQLQENTPAPQIEQTADAGPVDADTGEVIEAEVVEPDERVDWPEVAQPGSGS